ncbi:MAG TPA: ferrous iron transport protein A [Candidatus Hydrogenedentes bacterium]|nr:ferrous iron transport protein A [Candidatus Hydrogenedentota bacterium]
MKKTLFDLTTGDKARIINIDSDTPACVRMRLLDMGITKGAPLLVERHAPLGDPVEIVLKGYHLAIRMSEARRIEVELINGEEELPTACPAGKRRRRRWRRGASFL